MNQSENPELSAVQDEQAALWAGRLAGDELSAADRRNLAAWLAQHPRHRTLLSGYVALARKAERLMPQLAEAGRVSVPATAASSSPRVAWRGWLVGGMLAAAAAVAVMFFLPPSTPEPMLATAGAELASHALPDGSRVDLNARTQLALAFAADERRVRLARGEALFAVTKDTARPFVVETPAGEIRVTGTQFNVRLEAADRVEVTVLEGSVVVRGPDPQAAPLKLAAGDQLVLTGGAANLQQVTGEQLKDAIAWVKGFVVFDRMPLRDAAARYAAYHDKRIDVDAAVARIEFGGQYRIADLEAFLKAADQLAGVKVVTGSDGVVRIGPRL